VEETDDDLPPDNPGRKRLPPLLRRAWYSLNQAFRRRIAYSGLTPDQFTILRQLNEAPVEGVTQRELSIRMSSDPNTIASLLDRMEKADLVERKPHETDRRAHRVQVLEKGRKLYVELRDIALSLQTNVLEILPDDRRAQFLTDLEVIADACLLAAKEAPQTTIIKKPSAE